MLNKVATHTNANPVLSSSKTDTVCSNLDGVKMWYLRGLGLGHGITEVYTRSWTGTHGMEECTSDERRAKDREEKKYWRKKNEGQTDKIRNELLASGCRQISRVATHNRRRVLSSVKRGRPPACQSVRPSIRKSKEFHVCTVASLCEKPFLVCGTYGRAPDPQYTVYSYCISKGYITTRWRCHSACQ